MKVSLLGLCRSDGKILIKTQIERTFEGTILSFQSQIGTDTKIPCDSYQIANDDKPELYLIALPILSVTQKLIIEESDVQQGVISVFSKSYPHFRARAESGLRYRLTQSLTREINDCYNKRIFDRLSMHFWNCVPDDENSVLLANIIVPADSRIEALSISCIDSKGTIVQVNPVFFENNPYALVKFSSQQLHELKISLRIPKEPQNYCFLLQDSESPKNSGFSVLERDAYEKLLNGSTGILQNAQNDPGYDRWFTRHRIKNSSLELQRNIVLQERPLFSLVVPLYKTPLDVFCEMVNSVKEQSYDNWELILVNASPENNEVNMQAEAYASMDSRIKHTVISENKGISENTNVGIEVASGDFICFFDHDDLLEPDILFEYAVAINENEKIDVLYCDEDKLHEKGYYYEPFFKPHFNLDLLRNNNYVCHLLCIRKLLLSEIGFLDSSFDGAQDHDLTLRAIEKARAIHHVSKILYHWRATGSSAAKDVSNKEYATAAGIKAVQNHLDRVGLQATVEQSRRPFTYKVTYSIPQEHPLVSIIIPNKDNKEVLKACIDSILEKSTYSNYEIIIIDNNSSSEEVFKYYEELSSMPNIRIITHEGEFNFSKIINLGVESSIAEYLILLNNDTEVITTSWIERMLGICARKDVGVVGVKLYYPDNTIQHAGVVIVPLVAIHPHQRLPRSNWGYFSLNDAEQDMSAVTAACCMTKRAVFEQVGGFNEELAIAYNDVDYCLKIRERDLLVVYTPEVELYHFESLSRGDEVTKQEKQRYEQEASYIRNTWADYYIFGDPYYNKNLCSNGHDTFYFGLSD